MSTDYHDDEAPSPIEMGTLGFALAHHDAFEKYVGLRVHGIHSHEAFRRVFPYGWWEGSHGISRANNVEFNPWVISKLRDALATINPADLWNPRLAVHEMLSLSRDPYAKDSTRLGALKELNVLLNITVIDERGKTKAGRSLDDFYRDLAKGIAVESGDAGETQPNEQEATQ